MKKAILGILLLGMCFFVILDIAFISHKHTAQIQSKEVEVKSLKDENCQLKVVVDTLKQVCTDKNIELPVVAKRQLVKLPVKGGSYKLGELKKIRVESDTIYFKVCNEASRNTVECATR